MTSKCPIFEIFEFPCELVCVRRYGRSDVENLIRCFSNEENSQLGKTISCGRHVNYGLDSWSLTFGCPISENFEFPCEVVYVRHYRQFDAENLIQCFSSEGNSQLGITLSYERHVNYGLGSWWLTSKCPICENFEFPCELICVRRCGRTHVEIQFGVSEMREIISWEWLFRVKDMWVVVLVVHGWPTVFQENGFFLHG